jgi:acetyl-CoA C-acetyltransferase
MFIIGTGRTKFGVLSQSLPELAYEAMYNCIVDSPVPITSIDAIYVSSFLCGPLNGQLHLNSVIASLLPGLNIPIFRVETACSSASAAFIQALYSLERFSTVMVVGVEKMTSAAPSRQIEALAMAADHDERVNGLIFPASYALIAQEYLSKYNIKHEVLELVSFINHKNANANPFAHFYEKAVSREMIRNSRTIASPLNLFDCSPVSDGAVAVVVSKDDVSERDIEVVDSHLVTDTISLTQRDSLTSFKAAKLAAKKAYETGKLSPQDIDIVEVHDCFTISELIALEDLGFCKKGEAAQMVVDGDILRHGKLPVNTDGGLIGDGHPIGATGLAQIYEVVQQIRGEAQGRQVNNAYVGMVHNIGGVGGSAAVTILRGVK